MVYSSDYDELKNLENKIKNGLYIEKNPQDAISTALSSEKFKDFLSVKNLLALAYFENGEYEKAEHLYGLAGNSYQEGFCKLLCGNETGAKNAWYSASENSAIMWGKALLGFINLRVDFVPSFLQVRNFFESTLNYLMKANQIDYTESLISCEEVLADVNLETYKFIGRSLFNSGYQNLSFEYFEKSRKNIPHDPEIYYYLGLYSLHIKDYGETEKFMRKCLELNNMFTPARAILKNLSEAN
jgi:tetratricopeptide (TPR) repeat protein